MRETVRALETGALGEVALVAFVIAFVCVVAYALTLPKRKREELKGLPLDDHEVEHVVTAPEAPFRPGSSRPDA